MPVSLTETLVAAEAAVNAAFSANPRASVTELRAAWLEVWRQHTEAEFAARIDAIVAQRDEWRAAWQTHVGDGLTQMMIEETQP